MSLTHTAETTATRTANSPLLEKLTRAGFVGYGVVHLLFAWLAVQIAIDRPAGAGDQSGALQTLAAQPLGQFLVLAIAVGLGAMTLWQAVAALVGHREDQGTERVLERLASAGRAVVYLYFAWTAYRISELAGSSTGPRGGSSADKQQALTAQLMASPGGRWLVGLVGAAVIALGAGLLGYGLLRRFEKHLETGRMSARTRIVARRLGVAGYSAKGVAYGIAGLLVLVAAATYDPDKARGLDAALHTLREQSYGATLLILVATGIAAFGAFCLVQARYRKV